MLPTDWERLRTSTKLLFAFIVLLLLFALVTTRLLLYMTVAANLVILILVPLSLLWFFYRLVVRRFWRMYHLTFVRAGFGRDAAHGDLLLEAARRMHDEDQGSASRR